MSFASPAALFWLLLGIPIIGLYLLQRSVRRVPVPTLLFWTSVRNHHPLATRWQRLRRPVSLLVQLLLLTMMVLALADVRLPGQDSVPRRLIVVLDRSASMQATDIAPSRFEAAREAIRDVLADRHPDDEAALVVTGTPPVIAAPVSRHPHLLRKALKEIRPQDGPADLAAAVDLATRLCGDHTRSEILVVTDGCDPWNAAPPHNGPSNNEPADRSSRRIAVSQILIAGHSSPNIGLTRFHTRRSLTDPASYDLLLCCTNASSRTVTCDVVVRQNQHITDVVPLRMAPGATETRSLRRASVDGGLLTAHLTNLQSDPPGRPEPIDCLALDNTAWSVLPERQIRDVLLVTPGSLFLTEVLRAAPLTRLTVRNTLPDQWPQDSIVVLHRLVPDPLPERPVLIIDPEAPSDFWDIRGRIPDPVLTSSRRYPPLMAGVTLDNVVLKNIADLRCPDGSVLVSTADQIPVYADIPRFPHRCLLLNVNLEAGDLAFRTAFPILISSALDHLSGRSDVYPGAAVAGDTITLPVPAEDDSVEWLLIGPDGRTIPLANVTAPDRQKNGFRLLQAGPLSAAGIYRLRPRAAAVGDERFIAVNPNGERESDLRPWNRQIIPNRSAAEPFGRSRPVWFWLVACAALVLTVDWALYQRRSLD